MCNCPRSLYNIKRRVASLPPVSQETFNEKVMAAKATSSAAAAKASFERTCDACQKTFYSENSYRNHLNSSKHKLREARMGKGLPDDASSVLSSTFSLGEPINKTPTGGDTDVSTVAEGVKVATLEEEEKEEEQSADEEGFSVSHCLFCNARSADVQENVEHMSKSHGMFIPEKDYLVDLDGLINYLYRKITENNECLYCHVIRANAAGIRTHMRDKGHCMIAFETEEEQVEIGQFYDFRSTYSDDEHDTDTPESDGVKVSTSEADEDGWETETSASSVEEDDDETDDHREQAPAIYESEYELHLPSGRSVGHRSLARYYRQNLHNYPSADERAARQLAIENGEVNEEEEGQQQQQTGRNQNRALVTRANGGLGMVGATEPQKRAALRSERRERTRALRQEHRYSAKVNMAANNQKHYRVCSCPVPHDRVMFLLADFIFLHRTLFCNDFSLLPCRGNTSFSVSPVCDLVIFDCIPSLCVVQHVAI